MTSSHIFTHMRTVFVASKHSSNTSNVSMLHGAFWNKEHATVPGYRIRKARVPDDATHVFVLGEKGSLEYIEGVFATADEAQDFRIISLLEKDKDPALEGDCEPYFIIRIRVHDAPKRVRHWDEEEDEDAKAEDEHTWDSRELDIEQQYGAPLWDAEHQALQRGLSRLVMLGDPVIQDLKK